MAPLRNPLPKGGTSLRRAAASGAPPVAATSPLGAPLPPASIDGLAGLLGILAGRGGCLGLSAVADVLTFSLDDIAPLLAAADLLGFAEVAGGEVKLTASGSRWAGSPAASAKDQFAVAAFERAPLVRAITRALAATGDGALDERFFVDLLRRGFAEQAARAQIRTAIAWGSYGELFEFDAGRRQLRLEQTGRELATAEQDVKSA